MSAATFLSVPDTVAFLQHDNVSLGIKWAAGMEPLKLSCRTPQFIGEGESREEFPGPEK
jgi:hypothetical protein